MINHGTRIFLKPAATIAAIMMLAISSQPSHAASDVFATFRNSGSIGSGTPFVTLNVPGGKYAIFAKVGLDQDTTLKVVTVVCTLRAGPVSYAGNWVTE